MGHDDGDKTSTLEHSDRTSPCDPNREPSSSSNESMMTLIQTLGLKNLMVPSPGFWDRNFSFPFRVCRPSGLFYRSLQLMRTMSSDKWTDRKWWTIMVQWQVDRQKVVESLRFNHSKVIPPLLYLSRCSPFVLYGLHLLTNTHHHRGGHVIWWHVWIYLQVTWWVRASLQYDKTLSMVRVWYNNCVLITNTTLALSLWKHVHDACLPKNYKWCGVTQYERDNVATKSRVHVTMKYEHEHRQDLKRQPKKGTHKRYVPSQSVVVSSLKRIRPNHCDMKKIPRTVKKISVLTK